MIQATGWADLCVRDICWLVILKGQFVVVSLHLDHVAWSMIRLTRSLRLSKVEKQCFPNWYLEWLKDAMKYQNVEAIILAVDASLLTTLHTDEA